ncbi:transposase, Mutator family protein [Bacillus pseudomycoides]|nr:transposase, Mutator family protein [Bacillus pseudomycoides]
MQHIALRRETVSKETVYIAVGICEDGSKEVLAYSIAPTESAYNWQELLEELKDRGVENILLFISDGLQGMTDAISNVFTPCRTQFIAQSSRRRPSSSV